MNSLAHPHFSTPGHEWSNWNICVPLTRGEYTSKGRNELNAPSGARHGEITGVGLLGYGGRRQDDGVAVLDAMDGEGGVVTSILDNASLSGLEKVIVPARRCHGVHSTVVDYLLWVGQRIPRI